MKRLASFLRRTKGGEEDSSGRRGLPIPPLEMRQLVGPTDPEAFDNPAGSLVYPHVDAGLYTDVFDFGCGCGRVARQLIQQRARPERYLGIDIHRGMIKWCRYNLAPAAPGFDFQHHDVGNKYFNPGEDKPMTAPFPAPEKSFTLVNALSVFTHLIEPQAQYYLREASRVLRPDGVLHASWFLFDKTHFPMMQESQNALYINLDDPSNAVVYDKAWLRKTAADAGLTIFRIIPPEVRGFQWIVLMTPNRPGVEPAEFPPDSGRIDYMPPPPMPGNADRIGLGDERS